MGIKISEQGGGPSDQRAFNEKLDLYRSKYTPAIVDVIDTAEVVRAGIVNRLGVELTDELLLGLTRLVFERYDAEMAAAQEGS